MLSALKGQNMGLLERTVTPAMVAANRGNALKSTGPATALGRAISRRNALKHWGRAETIRPLLAALEEEAEEFDRLRLALYRSLAPRDEFEALLVDDMADIHWRIRRMVRGEAGVQAKQRRQRKSHEQALDARYRSGKFGDLERTTIPTVGFAGLQDSPVKFDRILGILRTLAEVVRHEGFQSEVVVYLQQLYGCNTSERARTVISLYDRCLKVSQTADAAEMEALQAAFQEAMADEIAWWENVAADHLQGRAELRAPVLEAELLNSGISPTGIATYHERMERLFERKWRMLMDYRDRQEASAQQEQGELTGQGVDGAVSHQLPPVSDQPSDLTDGVDG
jgi:hypothetical protein